MNGCFYQCFNSAVKANASTSAVLFCMRAPGSFAACQWLPRLNADFRVHLVGLAAACAGASNEVISCCCASLYISAGGFLRGDHYNVFLRVIYIFS